MSHSYRLTRLKIIVFVLILSFFIYYLGLDGSLFLSQKPSEEKTVSHKIRHFLPGISVDIVYLYVKQIMRRNV